MSATDAMSAPVDAVLDELRPSDLTPARTLGERLAAVSAFAALVLVDGVSKLGGFHRLYEMVRRWPRRGQRPSAERIESICQAVDRAAAFYFKRAWCLQRSATATCLLRLAGAPAEMVIGIEKIPFYAHAWVEIDGEVANDHPMVQRRYAEIDRC